MIIYGLNPVMEALRAGRVRRLRVSGRGDRRMNEALALARERGVPIDRVDAHVLDRAVRGGAHQGIVGEADNAREYSVAELVGAAAPGAALLVVLDGIEDPHNVGAIIRTANDGLDVFAVPFVADKSFPMLAYVEQQAESRTGISKQGQGMDPDALDKSKQITATQSAIMEEGRNSRAEMIARIFAETGVRDLFRKMLKLLVMHQPRARVIRLRNKWVEMDPRSWNADMDVAI